ncbi:Ca2+-transporting ATPase [Staphylotrichum tortipilum]|uniref:Calcium-transporting ATPase n=1 Tax=Staphylotrichum tortipilum TaxID=2831512 RepID=A0AAN6MIK5_9PEZI|nr:Ca2+-transporting ATPase [Staphylotrichum longicolle]
MNASSASNAAPSSPEAPSAAGETEPLEPSPGEEHLFVVENNPFAFSPGQLSKLIEPKSLPALQALGGIEGLERGLRTDRHAGLTANQALPHHGHKEGHFADRKRVFNEHILPERKPKSFLRLAWIALQDRVLVLLSIAAAVSLALGLYQTFGQQHDEGARVEWVEGVAIIIAILIVVIVGAANDWQKEQQFRKLNQKKEDRTVKVIRSGKPCTISVHGLLVGDVMILEQGDVIPVDGILIDGYTVSCDESSATGESDLVKKTPAEAVAQGLRDGIEHPDKLDPFMLSGAKVLDGVGTFLVTAVGPNSSHGRTMMALRDDPGMTPLQAKLSVLAGHIAKLGSAAGLLLFIVLFIEFLARLGSTTATSAQKAQSFLRILITSITVIVVAVPEGLPLAVTLSLAFATKKMTKVNNLVRHLQSCETMGNATVICSDKTGTLTENIMTVVGGTLGAGSLEFGDKTSAPAASTPPDNDNDDDDTLAPGSPISVTKTPLARSHHVPSSQLATTVCPDFRDLLKSSIALNTTAFEGDDNAGGRSPFVGTKTETALLDFARTRLAMGPLSIERANHHTVQIFPFNSRQKCMGSVIQLADGTYRLLVKGAPEVVLAQCTTTIPEPACVLSLDSLADSTKAAISSAVSRYASLSFRTLGFAYRDFDEWPSLQQQQEQQPVLEDVCDSMTWLAVVAIQDPVRPGVPAAVRTCHRASVAVKMVTGDNVETARAIARECGILPAEGGGVVMEGAEFRRLSEGERLGRVRELAVLARSSPEDKRVIVKALRALGEVVAVTGDGTNDAPALKAADVGFSMGVTGTEVAKEASDIILMDDNFSSIVEALAWGRAINDAVRKFLQFQITVNITAVVLTFVSAVASGEERSVLNAVQLLWVNLIMDTFAALALATDPPNDSLFDRAPEKRTASLINLTMWKMILGQSVYQLAVTFTLHFAGSQLFGYPDAQQRTLVFNVFVFMQIFKLVNSRRIDNKLNIFEGLHKNVLFMIMMAIMVIGQVIIIFFAGDAFGVKRLTAAQWGISLVFGFLSIPVGILIRLVPDAWVRKAAHSIPGPWRRTKRNDVPDLVIEGNGLGDALLDVKDSLAFLKKVRGGRVRVLSAVISGKSAPRSRTPSLSHMRSAVGMPGLLAATVGGLSPLGRIESEGVQVTAVRTGEE